MKTWNELCVTDLETAIDFFCKIFNYNIIHKVNNFAELHNGNNILMLNDDWKSHAHFSEQSELPLGARIEFCIEVEDLYEVYNLCVMNNVRILQEIEQQLWGKNDFRILGLENIYMRITSKLLRKNQYE